MYGCSRSPGNCTSQYEVGPGSPILIAVVLQEDIACKPKFKLGTCKLIQMYMLKQEAIYYEAVCPE